jgi:Xaa-Pro aminopeptidase
MNKDKHLLDISETLANHKADAFLMVGDSSNSDMLYATHFSASDSFAYIQLKDGSELVLVSDMEAGRAGMESRVPVVKTLKDCGYMEKVKGRVDPALAYCDCLAELLQNNNVRKIGVPRDFPYFTAQTLKEEGFSIEALKSPFSQLRTCKNDAELSMVKSVQEACNTAMEKAVQLIHRSEIVDGKLNYQGYDLTSKLVRKEIDLTLLEFGCEAESTIVAGGKGSANPHWEGEGILMADEPVVIDIFPRSKSNRYFADMTRTVVKGTPSEKLVDMYETVLAAQEAAIAMVKPGIKCSEIHNVVCDIFEQKGHSTIRDGSAVGFIHSTGHGVGLDIHELPHVGNSDVELQAGNIITIEPGLYYPDVGGIRIEDLLYVTEDGHENLTKMEKSFVV